MNQTPQQSPRPRLSAQSLRRGLLAGLFAWLVPGGGHLFLRARPRAVVFFLVIVTTTALGATLDGNLAVLDQRTPWLSAMSVGVNLSLGPWEPALRHTLYGTAVYSRSATRGEQTAALERRERREFETWSAYGSIYLMAAGLMNLLLILDAWDIAIGRKD